MKIKSFRLSFFFLVLLFCFISAVKAEAFFQFDLSFGDSGSDVTELQKLLNSDSDTQVAESGPGSSGEETDYFGSLTLDAVIEFQEKYSEQILDPLGLTSGTGYVGSATMSVLNSLFSGGSSSGSSGTSQTGNSQVDLSALEDLFSGWVITGDISLEDFESLDELIFSSDDSTLDFTSTSSTTTTTTSTSTYTLSFDPTQFGGLVTEASECDVDPNPYVELMMSFFSIIPCDSEQIPGYLFGTATPGEAVLGTVSPAGFVCVDGQGGGAPLGMVVEIGHGGMCF